MTCTHEKSTTFDIYPGVTVCNTCDARSRDGGKTWSGGRMDLEDARALLRECGRVLVFYSTIGGVGPHADRLERPARLMLEQLRAAGLAG